MDYHIWCDESDKKGIKFSHFYGGILVRSDHVEEVSEALKLVVEEQNITDEIKWQKVSEYNLPKYKAIIDQLFEFVKEDKVKIRIMFTQNLNKTGKLDEYQKSHEYHMLYYQFIKHGFGLKYSYKESQDFVNLKLYFDKLPDKKEKNQIFKDYIYDLQKVQEFEHIIINKRDIAEVDSKKHLLLQSLDLVLGSIPFRLNDKHKVKPEGKYRRARKTVNKEKMYKHILMRIKEATEKPHFNIGTNTHCDLEERWGMSYRHWLFKPKNGA